MRRDGQDARRHMRECRMYSIEALPLHRSTMSSPAHAAAHGVKIEGVSADLPTMLKRKDAVVAQNTKGIEYLFRKNKIEWAKGRGTLKAGNVVEVEGTDGAKTSYQAKDVIIATGSVPVELPFLKFDEERVLSNVGALTIPQVPQHLIVIGGGVIVLELGSVWRRLARSYGHELFPRFSGQRRRSLREPTRFPEAGLDIRAGTKVVGASRDAIRER